MKLMTTDEVAERLTVSKKTLEAWRQRGEGPPHVRLGGWAIRYRPEDVDRWVEAQRP